MKLFIIFFILIAGNTFAQDFKAPKIDESFFKDKRYEQYLGENAVVEYEVGSTYFVFVNDKLCSVTETKTRIKILNTDGFKHATIQIPLYRNRFNSENVTVTEAFTYNLENEKIEKTKFDDSNQFLENMVGNFWYVSFTMPKVKVGSLIEYKTKIISPYPEDVPEWFFQKEIPVIYSQFAFAIPQGLQFFQHIKGSEKVKSENVKGKFIYIAENVSPLTNQGFVSNLDNHRTSVIHYYSGYRAKDGQIKSSSGTWDKITSLINEKGGFVEALKEKNTLFLQKTTDEIIKDKINDQEKIAAILDYVQQNVQWNKQNGIVIKKDLKYILDNKEGNSVEINLLLIAMLRNANFEANPIILATKQKGISYLPHTNAFNNVIAGIDLHGKLILLDASSKFSRPNVIPLNNTNWIGRMIKQNYTSKEIKLEPTIQSKTIVNSFLNFDLENNSIFGTVRNIYSNYEAFDARSNYSGLSTDQVSKVFENKYKIEVDSVDIKNLDILEANVEEFFKLRKENAFDKVGDKIYFNPTFIFKIDSNIFKQEKRLYPIDFLYPTQNALTITYNIPEGYEVESVPGNKKIELESKTFAVRWIFSYDDKRIQIKWNIDYNKAIVDAHEYADIKKAFEELVKFMDEKVVLKKI